MFVLKYVHSEDSASGSVDEAAHDAHSQRSQAREGQALQSPPQGEQQLCRSTPSPDKLHSAAAPGLSPLTPGTGQSPRSRVKKHKISPLFVYNHGSVKSTGERSRQPSGRPGRLQFKMSNLIFLSLLYRFQILQ